MLLLLTLFPLMLMVVTMNVDCVVVAFVVVIGSCVHDVDVCGWDVVVVLFVFIVVCDVVVAYVVFAVVGGVVGVVGGVVIVVVAV